MAVYNAAPTVSYRQNYLGINTNAMEMPIASDAVLLISTANDIRTKIRLVTPKGEQIAYIDASNGNLDGFFIDGGIW
jgi:hypothetical protein